MNLWIGAVVECHHCVNSLTAWSKLLTTNVHLLDPGLNGCLTLNSNYLSAPEIIVVAAWGVCSPGCCAGYGMSASVIKAGGLNIVKSSEYFGIEINKNLF